MSRQGEKEILIYTDGSCHTQLKTGTWAAIIIHDGQKKILQGTEANTTHNRMELQAIINSIEYVSNNFTGDIVMQVFTDSQYVINIPGRFRQLSACNFVTKKGNKLPNADLLKMLMQYLEKYPCVLNKIRAHQREDDKPNFNNEADQLARAHLRAEIKPGSKHP